MDWATRIRPDDPARSQGVALLYSGGCDSTLAACRLAAHFPRVHLVTFLRFGFLHGDHPDGHAARMRARFADVDFPVRKIRYDRIYAEIEAHGRLRALWKHGTLTSVPCGHCKLAMHLRNLLYCLEHGVRYAADGAVHGNEQFPEQNANVLMEPLRELYASFGVTLLHPVFEDGLDTELGLYQLGVTDSPTVKRTRKDKQVVCTQHILFAMFMRRYLHHHTFEEYEEAQRQYLGGKLEHAKALVRSHVDAAGPSPIAHLLEGEVA